MRVEPAFLVDNRSIPFDVGDQQSEAEVQEADDAYAAESNKDYENYDN